MVEGNGEYEPDDRGDCHTICGIQSFVSSSHRIGMPPVQCHDRGVQLVSCSVTARDIVCTIPKGTSPTE